jgi:hypothetical protein
MTIGAWVVMAILAIPMVGIAVVVATLSGDARTKGGKIACWCVAGLILLATVAACYGFVWYRSNSETGKRALKDQNSNLHGGIERIVTIYDIEGDVLQQYRGKFDIETDQKNYILFDDENGDRHIVYFSTGTVVIDEVSGESDSQTD